MSGEVKIPWHSGGWIDESWDYTDEQKELIVAALETALDDQATARLLAEVTEEAREFLTFQSQWESRPGDAEIRKQLERIEKTCDQTLSSLSGLHGPTFDVLNEVREDAFLRDRESRGEDADPYLSAEQLIRDLKERAAILKGTAWTALRRYEPRGRKRADVLHMFAGELKRIFDTYAPGSGVTYVSLRSRIRVDYEHPWKVDAWGGRFIAFGRACLAPVYNGSVDTYLKRAWTQAGKLNVQQTEQ